MINYYHTLRAKWLHAEGWSIKVKLVTEIISSFVCHLLIEVRNFWPKGD